MGKIESRMVVVAVRAGKRPVDVLEMTYSQHALIGSGGYNPEDVEDVIAVMVQKNGTLSLSLLMSSHRGRFRRPLSVQLM